LKLAKLVEMEVKHRCNQILELGFPLGGIAKLFAQEWEGHVTVVMPATLAQVSMNTFISRLGDSFIHYTEVTVQNTFMQVLNIP